MASINSFKMSAARLTSVPHCTEAGLATILAPGGVYGDPIGWCDDSELGIRSHDNDCFVAVRTLVNGYGEVWGHCFKKDLKEIFLDE